MFKRFAALALAIGIANPVSADLIRLESPHTVSVTMDKLAAAVEGAGATIVARVNHAKAAEGVDLELAPVEMLMFGNPRLGTPAMQADPASGLDLPLRVVVYQSADGQVTLAYHDPAELAATYGIPADAEVITKMTGALANLTGAAVAE